MTEHAITAQPVEPTAQTAQPTHVATPPSPAPQTRRPRFTITEAATVCDVHPDTIRRRLKDLAENGAEKDDSGAWSIPVEALLSVGLKPGKPSAPEAPAPSAAQTSPGPVAASPVSQSEAETLRQEIEVLKHRLELEQVRRETAERLVDVHRDALDEARAWRRILEAGPSARAEAVPVPSPAALTAPAVAPQHRAHGNRLANAIAALKGS